MGDLKGSGLPVGKPSFGSNLARGILNSLELRFIGKRIRKPYE
jgi:hypothetical protein